MQMTILGRTGLSVSVAGLGCGGQSRLGQRQNASIEQSIAIVKGAIDLGINIIDTAPAYRTEEIVGQAIKGQRDCVVLSTKSPYLADNQDFSSEELRLSLERSLRALGTDHVDILHLHCVPPGRYGTLRDRLLPELLRLKDEGKTRFIGITEQFAVDTAHDTLAGAAADDHWDVVMVGFNLLNPSARRTVLAPAEARGTGVLNMFSVRRALSQPRALRKLVRQMVRGKLIPKGALDRRAPLDFLVREGQAENVVDAAYRFCRHQKGVDVVLTGTGKLDHLKENVASINGGPLDPAALDRLEELFGSVNSISGN